MRKDRALLWLVIAVALSCGESKRADDGARSRSGGTSGDATGGTPQGGDGGTSGSTAGGTAGDVTGGVGGLGGSAGEGAVGGDSGDAGEAGSSGAAAGDTSLGGTGGAGGAAGSGGLGGAGAGAVGGGSGGAGAECPIPSVLFPPVVPTDQATGLTGVPSPVGAPEKSFDSYNLQSICADTSCDECSSAGWRYEGRVGACRSGGGPLDGVQNFAVGGLAGMSYRVTLHFYGVVEPKDYGPNVTRESGTVRPDNLNTGATPPPWAYASGSPSYTESDYGTWELHVVDHEGNDVCSYFLNSDTTEGNWTYMLSFERTINVIGGGRLRIRRFDRDCRIVKNCFAGGTQGACSATGCNNKARTIDVSAAMPPPTSLHQPGLQDDTAQSGQWLLIDVVNVACGLPALGCDGR